MAGVTVARREVICGDGVELLRRGHFPDHQSVVTSLPDASELPGLGFEGWREWFVETSALACAAVADEAVSVFYQTDVKRDGRWVDKAHLVLTGADGPGRTCSGTRWSAARRPASPPSAAPPTRTCSASRARCASRRAARRPTCSPASAR